MHARTLALIFATAIIGSGCVSDHSRSDGNPARRQQAGMPS